MIKTKRNSLLPQEEAIKKLKEAAPELDFSKFVYAGFDKEGVVIHPTRGEYSAKFCSVLRLGSKKRGEARRKSNEDFIKELTEELTRTGDLEKYDLSKVNYVRATEKVLITCKTHGDKLISPFHLLNGRRCGECKPKRLADKFRGNWEVIKARALIVHGDTYDYSKFVYINSKTAGVIVCKRCGLEFKTDIDHHLTRGDGCSACKKHDRHEEFLITGKERFIKEARRVHLDRYSYANVEFVSFMDKVSVTCSKTDKDGRVHGEFLVSPNNHLTAKSGCPKCSNKISLDEIRLRMFVEELGFEVECNVAILDKYHVDIFIPSRMVGIEYCGLYWHGESYRDKHYHLKKYLLAKSKGIHLIQVFEDEWVSNSDRVKSVLSNKLGKHLTSIYARNTEFREISNSDAKSLYNEVHLQGGNTSMNRSFGLIHDGVVVASMSFSTSNVETGIIDLARFASRGRVIGGFSKILANSIPILHTLGISTIISFSDNRWSDGNVYESNGFLKISEDDSIIPRYWWVKGVNRYHRRLFQRKHLKVLFGETFVEEESESENSRRHGYYKIWDAGVTKWSLSI